MKRSASSSAVSNKGKQVPHRQSTPADKPFCAYLHRVCTRPRLDGYLYCIVHILNDKTASFQQCTFVQPANGKRCSNAAPKNDRHESLCPWHVKQANLAKMSVKKNVSCSSAAEADRPPGAFHQFERAHSSKQSQLVQSATCSDMKFLGSSSEGQKARLSEAWLGLSDESSSDLDESDREDPLQHAGVYTYEEVARIYRDKLIHLQSLYLEQFKWLFYVLKEKRRDYLHDLKNEKKTGGQINKAALSKEDRMQYRELKALRHYHRPTGQEAVLRRKSLKKKMFREGIVKPSPPSELCTFSEGGTKCTAEAVVLTKFCWNHILSDPRQVMFKQCAAADCRKPIVPYADNTTCLLHTPVMPSSTVTSDSERSTEVMYIPSSLSSASVAGPSGMRMDMLNQEPDLFQSMDDIASLGLDAMVPGSLFGLNQFGELGESTDSALSCDNGPYMVGSASEMLCHPQASETYSD